MVPQSLQEAWKQLQETQKVAFCRAIAAKQPQVFMAWTQAAALKFPPQLPDESQGRIRSQT